MSEDTPKSKLIQLSTLANELGKNPASMKKFVRRRGIEPIQLRSGANKPWFITSKQYEQLRSLVAEEENHAYKPEFPIPRTGGVYCLEVPTYEGPFAYKIGWADSFKDRFDTYRTIVPNLRIKALWQTDKRYTENMALDVAAHNGQRVHTELFLFAEIEDVLSTIDSMFSALNIKKIAITDIIATSIT